MNLVPRPNKYSSDPALSSRQRQVPPLKTNKIHPISPEKDESVHSGSRIKRLNKHFEIKLDSKKNLDTFDKVNRVRYPKTLKNNSKMINKGNLHQKLPKISKKMMTRYNLMNDINLPYQDNNMRIYDPNMNYWDTQVNLDQEDAQGYFSNFNHKGHRIIDAARRVETVADPKFTTARLHNTRDAYGGYDAEYPSERKYRVHLPESLAPKLQYMVPYQNTLRPFNHYGGHVQLVEYPSRKYTRRRKQRPRELKKNKKTKSRSRKKKKDKMKSDKKYTKSKSK